MLKCVLCGSDKVTQESAKYHLCEQCMNKNHDKRGS
jgi:hypothetical protein